MEEKFNHNKLVFSIYMFLLNHFRKGTGQRTMLCFTSTRGSTELFRQKSIWHPSVCSYVVNFSHFQLLQNHCMSIHQPYVSCSSRGPVEELYLFEAIRNLRQLSWHLICRDIFTFFSRITVCEVSRLARDVPLELKKYCFSERFKVQQCCLVFDWPRRI